MDVTLFEENIEILRKSGGKWVDSRLIMMTAAQISAKGKRINGTDFKNLADLVKKSASTFSQLKTIYFSMAGLIYAKEKNNDDEINKLLRHYNSLREVGLRPSIYTYIAAFLMEDNMSAERIKNIHEEMKKNHRFLTSYDDYPAAVIMAKQPERIEELLKVSEKYYLSLHEKGFSKGNDLQFLANMLVMNGSFSIDTVNKVVYAKDLFDHNKLKVRSMHYPAIGIIALSNKTKEALTLSQELISMKSFKWYKNIAVTIASIFVSQDYSDASAGLTASIEAMIQAQQAAMIAATAAVVSTSSTSSGE